MSIGTRIAQGVFWTYLSFFTSKLLVFVSTVILARLLAPQDFGQVAIALLAISYLEAIGDLGMAGALIYQRDQIERASHMAFWISMTMGIGLWVLAMLGAPAIALYFNEPAVAPMLQVLALTFVLQAFGNVQKALLSKELQFRRKLLPEVFGYLAKGIGSILFALLGWGPWSLVWGQILGVVVMTVVLWLVHPWRPVAVWDFELGRRMIRYGIQVIGVDILAVVWSTIDYIIIAKQLGDAELGLYQQAFRVSDLLIINLCFLAGRVLFPSYVKLSDKPEAVQGAFLTTLRYISLITLPIGLGLFAAAELFVSVVFGSKWLAMTPALQWLTLRATIHAISFNSGNLLKAIGRPDIVNKQMVLKLAVLIPTILFSVRFGFVGVALGQVGVTLFSVLLELGTIVRLVRISVGSIWRQIYSTLLAGVSMAIVVRLFLAYLPEQQNLFRLSAAIALGVLWYSAVLWLTERSFVLECVRSVAQMLRPHRRTPMEH